MKRLFRLLLVYRDFKNRVIIAKELTFNPGAIETRWNLEGRDIATQGKSNDRITRENPN